jgi:hypothetical protein
MIYFLNDNFCYGESIRLQHNDPWNKNKVGAMREAMTPVIWVKG